MKNIVDELRKTDRPVAAPDRIDEHGGSVHDLVMSDVIVRLERIDHNIYWLGIIKPDGSRIDIDIVHEGRGRAKRIAAVVRR